MKPLSALRCRKCSKKLLLFRLETGRIEVLCRITSCKTLNVIDCQAGRCTYPTAASNVFTPTVDNSFRVTVAQSV